MLDFVLAPVERGMCKYESLLDGTLNLGDIALMNDVLAVRSENEWRSRKASSEKA